MTDARKPTSGFTALNTLVDGEVFARLVGRYPEKDTLLFEVSSFFAETETNQWSDPMRFRFVRREGAKVELEFHRIDLTAVDEDAL